MNKITVRKNCIKMIVILSLISVAFYLLDFLLNDTGLIGILSFMSVMSGVGAFLYVLLYLDSFVRIPDVNDMFRNKKGSLLMPETICISFVFIFLVVVILGMCYEYHSIHR